LAIRVEALSRNELGCPRKKNREERNTDDWVIPHRQQIARFACSGKEADLSHPSVGPDSVAGQR
jgi:hypothetical protein